MDNVQKRCDVWVRDESQRRARSAVLYQVSLVTRAEGTFRPVGGRPTNRAWPGSTARRGPRAHAQSITIRLF